MWQNEGTVDRVVRGVVGAVLVGVGFGPIPGVAGIVVGIVGLIPLLTGIIGFCPLYPLFKINTKKA